MDPLFCIFPTVSVFSDQTTEKKNSKQTYYPQLTSIHLSITTSGVSLPLFCWTSQKQRAGPHEVRISIAMLMSKKREKKTE